MRERLRVMFHSKRAIYSLSIVWFGALLLAPMTVNAASGAIAQSYQTSSTNIGTGSLVSLVSAGSSNIEPAFASNVSNLVGIAAEKPALELSKGSSSSVQVVVSGSTMALVSDANGAVMAGDKITASPISGVGMKATSSAEIVGTAQKNLTGIRTVTESVSNSNGGSSTVHVGLMPIAVAVVYYSNEPSSGTVSTYIPSVLQSVANSLTGKQVSPVKVLIGTLLLLLGFATVSMVLYIGIHSHIISIGRNPLAQAALRKGLVDVLIASLGILIVCVVIVYAILLS